MFYTQVGPDGYITLSMYTTDPTAIVPVGHRLLPDNPPQPPQIDLMTQSLRRIEPVPFEATEIPYEIKQLEVSKREHEVLL